MDFGSSTASGSTRKFVSAVALVGAQFFGRGDKRAPLNGAAKFFQNSLVQQISRLCACPACSFGQPGNHVYDYHSPLLAKNLKMSSPRRLVVGISGATGAIFAVRLLQMLRKIDIETHLMISRWGARTLLHETPYTLEQVQAMATKFCAAEDQGAAISSGSFVTDGMVLCPCSVRSLAAIAHGHGDNLLHRAADVVLKERRKLVLVVRETPLSDIHLENMLKLSRMGVVIFPPVPAFYTQPQSIDDIVDQTVTRILDQFGIHVDSGKRWEGLTTAGNSARKSIPIKSRRSGSSTPPSVTPVSREYPQTPPSTGLFRDPVVQPSSAG